jgi:hypothetical protein
MIWLAEAAKVHKLQKAEIADLRDIRVNASLASPTKGRCGKDRLNQQCRRSLPGDSKHWLKALVRPRFDATARPTPQCCQQSEFQRLGLLRVRPVVSLSLRVSGKHQPNEKEGRISCNSGKHNVR